MKNTQKIVIGLGIVISILIGIGLWVYLLIYEAPVSIPGLGTDFSNIESPPSDFETSEDTSGETSLVTSFDEALVQLTSRPVAGAVFIEGGIRYVERGTGHIYDIALEGREESRVSVTTIPRTTQAIFSPEGGRVALISETNDTQEAVVATVTKNDTGEGIVDGVNLPSGAHEIAFNALGSEVYYLIDTPNGSAGYAYDVTEKTSRELFSIPLSDIRVLWGDTVYVYTTPSAEAIGYIYEVNGNELAYFAQGGRSLAALRYNEGIVVSRLEEPAIRITAYEDGAVSETVFDLFTEKCTAASVATSTLYCAAPLSLSPATYPDQWYKGLVSLSDGLWSIKLSTGTAELMTIFEELVERPIDVSDIGIDEEEQYIQFTDKNDGTLWLFNRSAQ